MNAQQKAVAVFGPYATPTARARPRLSLKMKQRENAWWIPFPMGQGESAEFLRFLQISGVVLTYFGQDMQDYEADHDLCPYVWAWRLGRGEIEFTALGRNQYAKKQPFCAPDPLPLFGG